MTDKDIKSLVVVNLLVEAIKILHPKPEVWCTPTDEQVKLIENALHAGESF